MSPAAKRNKKAKTTKPAPARKATKPKGKPAKAAPKPAAKAKTPQRRHCIAADPFGGPCQSVPRLPSKYCTIHSYLDR